MNLAKARLAVRERCWLEVRVREGEVEEEGG